MLCRAWPFDTTYVSVCAWVCWCLAAFVVLTCENLVRCIATVYCEAFGAAIGTLIMPGTGTAVGQLLFSVVPMLF